MPTAVETNATVLTAASTAPAPAPHSATNFVTTLLSPPYVYILIAIGIAYLWWHFKKGTSTPSGVQVFERLFRKEIQEKLRAFAVKYPIWSPAHFYVGDRYIGKIYSVAEFEAVIPEISAGKNEKPDVKEREVSRYVILQRGWWNKEYYIIPREELQQRNDVFVVKSLAVEPIAHGVYLLAPTEREKRMIYDMTWKWFSKDLAGTVATLATKVARGNPAVAAKLAEIEGWGELEEAKHRRRVTSA